MRYMKNCLKKIKIFNNLKNFYGSNYCNYPRKFQIIAFLIESITIIGLGHFYLNRFLHGFIKMGLFFSLIFFDLFSFAHYFHSL